MPRSSCRLSAQAAQLPRPRRQRRAGRGRPREAQALKQLRQAAGSSSGCRWLRRCGRLRWTPQRGLPIAVYCTCFSPRWLIRVAVGGSPSLRRELLRAGAGAEQTAAGTGAAAAGGRPAGSHRGGAVPQAVGRGARALLGSIAAAAVCCHETPGVMSSPLHGHALLYHTSRV